MTPDRSIRFDSLIQFRAPENLQDAIGTAARQRGSKPAEYVRQAVMSALRADGIEPMKILGESRPNDATPA